MTHTYQITGMTCGSCEAKVKSALLTITDVTDVEVSKENNTGTISMDKHVDLPKMQKVLGDKYQISRIAHHETEEEFKSWLATYKPVLLIFVYIFSATAIIELTFENVDVMRWMRHFMAGFFIVFAFF